MYYLCLKKNPLSIIANIEIELKYFCYTGKNI